MLHKTRVGVLRGGPSSEYDVSLLTGANVLRSLAKNHDDKYAPLDIFIDREGIWHVHGSPKRPEDILHHVDVIWNGLHGSFGEDGKVQRFLEIHSIPFTGSGSVGSAMGMNKSMTKKILTDHGIKTPYWKEFSSEAINENMDKIVAELFSSFLLPAVVKPNTSGSSMGVTIVTKYADLKDALNKAATHSPSVLVEEYIKGDESTCGVIDDFRGEEIYALPPIEIRPSTGFFDYDAKYSGKSREIIPANFSFKIKEGITALAKKIHSIFGLKHYSRTDFIIHPRRGIYVLEVNTLPGLTEESLIPKSLDAVGSNMGEFVEHVLTLALNRK